MTSRPSCSTLFTASFRNRNLGWKCLTCQLCPGTSSRTSRPSWPLLPSFRVRAKDERVQTGTVKFFDKALSKLAGMKDTELSAYLHRKATAWYKQFLPIHSPDRAEDPKTPQVDGGNGVGGSPEDEEDVEDRPVASESSSDETIDEGWQ